jgi:hypothetical protein
MIEGEEMPLQGKGFKSEQQKSKDVGYGQEKSHTGSRMGKEANATFTTPDQLEQGAPTDEGERGTPEKIDRQSAQLANFAKRKG